MSIDSHSFNSLYVPSANNGAVAVENLTGRNDVEHATAVNGIDPVESYID
ncbi:MAG: hypothetical protein O3C21_04910 [Verrucomicrobia bacterium]|nr:hypothetical protein [Verrucomicrobiota bacterium]